MDITVLFHADLHIKCKKNKAEELGLGLTQYGSWYAFFSAQLTGTAAVPASARLKIRHVPNFWVIKYKKFIKPNLTELYHT